eukprot:6472613-Amphidinium_carterae.1
MSLALPAAHAATAFCVLSSSFQASVPPRTSADCCNELTHMCAYRSEILRRMLSNGYVQSISLSLSQQWRAC